jgi:hypothetical protein
MKNETIKTYTLVANTAEALRLTEAGESLYFQIGHDLDYVELRLLAIKFNRQEPYQVLKDSYLLQLQHCYTMTEFEPCESPDGCPELEPWLAYVGLGKDIPESEGQYYVSSLLGCWKGSADSKSGFNNERSHYAVDVRTAWAQEHFPEHCRIRAYQEPSAFDVAWKAEANTPCSESIARFFYELGQANPLK